MGLCITTHFLFNPKPVHLFKMKFFSFFVLIVVNIFAIEARNVACGPRSTRKSVTVHAGDSFTYKTQKGIEYRGNTDCTVKYKLGNSCARMSFICSKMNIVNLDGRDCGSGDKLVVSSKEKTKTFCNKKTFRVVSSEDLTTVFTSDAKEHSTGAKCMMTCSQAAQTENISITNNFGQRMNFKFNMVRNRCADGIVLVTMNGIPRDGLGLYGDPQPSCLVKIITAYVPSRYPLLRRVKCSANALNLGCPSQDFAVETLESNCVIVC